MAFLMTAAASALALLHSTLSSSSPLTSPDPAAPRPQNGVWALAPGDCPVPSGLDFSTWPKCAVPIGFLDDEVAALERPGPGKRATADEFYSVARTKFAMAPGVGGGPAVAEIAVPMVFSRSYYYLAIAPDAMDADGRFAAARGWPVGCLPKDKGGCTPKTIADVQAQAAAAPGEPGKLYRLIRIQAPATTDAPTAPAAPAAQPLTAPAPATTPPAPAPAPAPTSSPPPELPDAWPYS
jgi:hypothetical protein